MVDLEQLEREARRVYLRYAVEVVESYSFCPWARAAREQGQVRTEVIASSTPSVADVVEVVERVGADAAAQIGLLLFPCLPFDRVPFQRFVADVRVAYARREDDGAGFAMAEFHPNAAPDTSTPGRTLSFIRRSPDPTIQLVRLSALASVRKTEDQGTSYVDPAEMLAEATKKRRYREPLNERVAIANRQTIDERGSESIDAVMRDITEDRNRSYARLGLPPSPWSLGESPDGG